MAPRINLQLLLETILGSDAVYFQPPASLRMVYPCIVYKYSTLNTKFADNTPYVSEKRYMITVIDKDPDSLIPDKIASLPKCIHDRNYTADNLNHWVFNLYY